MIVLSDKDVVALADMKLIVAAVERAMKEKAKGNLICPPRHSVQFADEGSLVFTTGGITGKECLAGFRVYETFEGPGENHTELVAVWDSATAELKGIVLGESLGALRTGAIGGVAVKYMSRPNSKTVGVIGAGLQASTQLMAAAAVRSLETVKVFSRTASKRKEFARRMRKELDLDVVPVSSSREAAEDVDIVICATTASKPVIVAEWLAPGTHVNTVGPKYQGENELGTDIADVATVIATDSPAQIASYSRAFFLANTAHMDAILDLSTIVSGQNRGRSGKNSVTLFCSVGLAGTEVLVASKLIDASLSSKKRNAR